MKLPGRNHRKTNRHRQRAHALEHLLAGLIRKYGDEGQHVLLDEETFVGHYMISLSPTPHGGVLIELLDECSSCGTGDGHAV
jgi:S-ribosylhomocysteine lyase LuxS involved in autoinducer biosynthesis